MATPRRAETTAQIALWITVALAAAKVAVWLATGSLTVLSQALDSIVDIVALGLVLLGVRIAAKPADETHHYGHGKAENLVAFAQTLFLGAIVVGVGAEAVARLLDPEAPPQVPLYAMVLLGTGAVIDTVRVRMLTRAARAERSAALGAGALNLATDVGTAVVALVSLVAVRAGLEHADAWGALIVAAAVAVAGYQLGKRSVDVLMDRAPALPVEAIAAAETSTPGVAETRRVRVRGTEQQMFADVTVATGRTVSLERAHDVAESVERAIESLIPGVDVVVHVEPSSDETGLVERAQAAASRTEGVHEVHNVLVHAFDDAGERKLHVTLHAKISAGASLADAHDLSDRIEQAVAQELGPGVRVDSHIEPLVTTDLGRDVTDERPDVIDTVRSHALEEPDVLDCHEVLVTSAAGGRLSIVAHVHGRRDLPLARIHDASERIEKAVHARHPDVGAVVIHFEPA